MGDRKTVLVVDDEPLVRDGVALVLNEMYDVLVARDGAEGLNIYDLEKERVSLVITDCEMPGLNGIQLTVRLWRENPNLPVVMITGMMRYAEMKDLCQMRNFHLLRKPFTPIQLKALVWHLTGELTEAA